MTREELREVMDNARAQVQQTHGLEWYHRFTEDLEDEWLALVAEELCEEVETVRGLAIVQAYMNYINE